MHEREKLKEAKYFSQCMEASVNNQETFQYQLSAFLSAARCVLQYALEEAKNKTGGANWYQTQVTNKDVLKFFKDKRDLNIHAKPIQPDMHISLTEHCNVNISESLRIEILKEDGTVERVIEHEEKTPQSTLQESSSDIKIHYMFEDWSGSEDVIALSRQYLGALESFVSDGVSSNYISG